MPQKFDVTEVQKQPSMVRIAPSIDADTTPKMITLGKQEADLSVKLPPPPSVLETKYDWYLLDLDGVGENEVEFNRLAFSANTYYKNITSGSVVLSGVEDSAITIAPLINDWLNTDEAIWMSNNSIVCWSVAQLPQVLLISIDSSYVENGDLLAITTSMPAFIRAFKVASAKLNCIGQFQQLPTWNWYEFDLTGFPPTFIISEVSFANKAINTTELPGYTPSELVDNNASAVVASLNAIGTAIGLTADQWLASLDLTNESVIRIGVRNQGPNGSFIGMRLTVDGQEMNDLAPANIIEHKVYNQQNYYDLYTCNIAEIKGKDITGLKFENGIVDFDDYHYNLSNTLATAKEQMPQLLSTINEWLLNNESGRLFNLQTKYQNWLINGSDDRFAMCLLPNSELGSLTHIVTTTTQVAISSVEHNKTSNITF